MLELSCGAPFRAACFGRVTFLAGPLVTASLTLMGPWDLRCGIGVVTGISVQASDRVAVIVTAAGIFTGGVRFPWYRYLDTLCTYNYYLVFGVPVLPIRRDRSPRIGFGGNGRLGVALLCRIGR